MTPGPKYKNNEILTAENSAGEVIKLPDHDNAVFSNSRKRNRELITIFEEDFEDGAEDWEHYDATGTDDWLEAWHLSETGAYEGNSWWMGDE